MTQKKKWLGEAATSSEPVRPNPSKGKDMNKSTDIIVANKGATHMNRRRFLASAPVAAAALSIPAVAIADEDDPRVRLRHHIEGVKLALQEIDPSITSWWHATAEDDQLEMRFFLSGSRELAQ